MKIHYWLGSFLLLAACSAVSSGPAPEPPPIVKPVKTVARKTPTPPAAVKAPTADKASAPAKTPTPPKAASEQKLPPGMKRVTKESQQKRVEANKLRPRPIKNEDTEAAKAKGKIVGPIVTFAGAARADGNPTEPIGKTGKGVPIFLNHVGSGFFVVVEAKPGYSNLEPGRSIFQHDPKDPSKRPDLQIQVDRPMGDGSEAVCDARPPRFGGIPAISPMSFAENQRVSAALNDLSCRFETFIESDASCTNAPNGDFSFLSDDSTVQFCMVVARKWRFAEGDTTVSVRMRDREGNPGPISQFVLRREPRPTRPPRTAATVTPTPVRRRP